MQLSKSSLPADRINNVSRTQLLSISLMLTILLSQASFARGQNPATSDQAWDNLRAIAAGEKIEMETKDGKKLTGQMFTATQTEVTLSRKKSSLTIRREEILNLWLISQDTDKRKRYAGIGAIAGLLAGVGITVVLGEKEGSNTGGTKAALAVALAGGTVGGGLIGRAIGGHRKRTLVYSTK